MSSKRPYENCGRGFNGALQKVIFEKIDSYDGLTVRALSTWLKSSMLSRHVLFFEEAIYCLYISLEASLGLIFQRLKKEGMKQPTPLDAGRFLSEVFGQQWDGLPYFSAYYQDRIKALHPQSRFGIFPFAPLMVDDYFFLYEDLREVFVFLLTGIVEPDERAGINPSPPPY